MNILLFSYYNPLGKGGFEKQAMGLVKTLARQGHQIACLTITNPENQTQLQKQLEETGVFNLGSFVISHLDVPYNKTSQVLFWFQNHPTKFLGKQKKVLYNQIQVLLETIIEKLNIDLVHVLGMRTTYYLPIHLNKPTIIDLVDSMALRKKRALNALPKDSNIWQYFYHIMDFKKTQKLEKDILNLYGEYSPIATISPIDQNYLLSLKPSPFIKFIPAATDIETDIDVTKQLSNLNESPKSMVFFGFMTEHNIDGLLYLIYDILPMVKEIHPDLVLKITGFNIPPIIFELAEKITWLKVIPSIENISEFVLSATLTCWPFRLGCGIKTKILECMVLGRPIVTTIIGSEALTESQKKGLLIADTAQGLAEHIIYLLDNPDERLRLGKINYEIATTEFTWERKAQDYLQLYQLAQDQFNQKK